MYSIKANFKLIGLSLICCVASLGLALNHPEQALADTPITQNMPAKVKQQLQQKAYPDWVNNAIGGTPYTASEFFNLPLAQQLASVQELHPEIDPKLVKDSYLGTTVADTTNSVTDTTTSSLNTNNPIMFARAASFAFAAPAASTTYNSYIDLAPAYISGGATKIAVPTYAGTTAETTQDYLNIGNLTANDLVNAQVTAVDADLIENTDYTYSLESNQLVITLTEAGLNKIINSGEKCYQGNKFSLTIISGSTTLVANFNVWLPQIDRAHATLNNNTDLELRFGYGSPLADSQPTQTNQLNGDTYFLDVPNFNIVDKSAKAIEAYKNDEANKDTINGVGASGNEGVRVYSLYSDTVYTNSFQNIPKMGENKLTTADELVDVIGNTTPLLFGNKDRKNETKDRWYLGYFDTYKHIHMYPDANDPNLICLDYDGYLKDEAALDAIYPNTFNKVTDPLHLSVQNTLAATNNNQSMVMNEIVTNRSSHDLPGLFFFRGYDTAMGIGPAYASDWASHRYDYVPIYFGAKATTGVRAGNVQGLYLRPPNSSQLNYTLDFNFNTPDAPDSWSGLRYNVIGRPTGSTDFFISSDLIKPSDKNDSSKPIFNTPAGKAHAGWPYSKDNIKDSETTTENKIAFGSETAAPDDAEMDSSIIMKWSPAQVGTLAVDKSYDMSYDISANTASAPRLSMTESYLRVKDNTTKISGTVSDLDSRYVSIYYTIDPKQAVTPGDGLPNSQSNLLTTVDLGAVEENVNHNQYVPFEETLSDEEVVKKLTQYQAEGHHIYFYAVDSVDSKGTPVDTTTKGYVSNIEDIRANVPVQVTVNGIPTGGTAPTTVTKQLVGYAGDTYNLYDAAKDQGSIFEPDEATLVSGSDGPLYVDTKGYAPQTLQQDTDLYALDTTKLPDNASGTFELDQAPLTLDYHYTYNGSVALTAPGTLDFGKHAQTLDNGQYNLQDISGDNLKVTDSTSNKAYEVQVSETKPLTLDGDALEHGLGYQVSDGKFIDLGDTLTAPATVYSNPDSASEAVVDISKTWQKTDSGYQNGPMMTINDSNRNQVKAGQYTGLLTWTVVKSL